MNVHESKYGTYHPADSIGSFDPNAWTINDTRGTIDAGPSCDECGACECPPCSHETAPIFGAKHGRYPSACEQCHENHDKCVGLSFAFVCLDGGDTLCEACAEKAGVKIVPCDCE